MREVADPQPPTLPQELINKIIYFCRRDPTALCSWCLVSSACLFDARKYLYWKISFVSYWRLQFAQFDWHLDWGRSSDFLASIKKNHQLPRLIRDLNFKLTDGPWSAQLWETFLVVFPTMTSLERFQYSCLYSDFGRPTLERLLCGTTMKLKEFEVFTNAPIDHLEYLPRFLQQQGDLEVLSLRCDWNRPALRPDACPRLHTLTTWSRRFIEAIIPGRPVVKLCWNLCQPLYFGVPGDYNETGYPVTVQLSRALSQIRILILRGTHSHGRLPLVAPHLPVLEVLDLEEFSVSLHLLVCYAGSWD